MSFGRTFRRKMGKTATGDPVTTYRLPGGRAIFGKGVLGIKTHLDYAVRRRSVNHGCNVGGSASKPMRFPDGRLRNRAQPKVYKRQADGTYA